jgi:hypothetical protein
MARVADPFPWASLERLSRSAVRRAREARPIVERAVRLDRLGPALAELLSAEVILVMRELRAAGLQRTSDDVCVEIGDATLVVRLDAELATVAVARLLGRAAPITSPGAPLGPVLGGAVTALVIEAARRSGAAEALHVAKNPPPAGAPVLRAEATLLLDGRPYGLTVDVALSPSPSRAFEPRPSLETVGDLPVALPLVTSLASAHPDEIATLAVGDAWMPSDGWWIDASGAGRGALAGPLAERGLGVDLATDGTIVLRDRVVPLSADTGDAMSSQRDDVIRARDEAVLDTPVVVRVEVGAVSMTAREWAALRPGDVIETGQRINEPVVLRVGGRELARGELVEIEGELGVRIRELAGGGDAP